MAATATATTRTHWSSQTHAAPTGGTAAHPRDQEGTAGSTTAASGRTAAACYAAMRFQLRPDRTMADYMALLQWRAGGALPGTEKLRRVEVTQCPDTGFYVSQLHFRDMVDVRAFIQVMIQVFDVVRAAIDRPVDPLTSVVDKRTLEVFTGTDDAAPPRFRSQPILHVTGHRAAASSVTASSSDDDVGRGGGGGDCLEGEGPILFREASAAAQEAAQRLSAAISSNGGGTPGGTAAVAVAQGEEQAEVVTLPDMDSSFGPEEAGGGDAEQVAGATSSDGLSCDDDLPQWLSATALHSDFGGGECSGASIGGGPVGLPSRAASTVSMCSVAPQPPTPHSSGRPRDPCGPIQVLVGGGDDPMSSADGAGLQLVRELALSQRQLGPSVPRHQTRLSAFDVMRPPAILHAVFGADDATAAWVRICRAMTTAPSYAMTTRPHVLDSWSGDTVDRAAGDSAAEAYWLAPRWISAAQARSAQGRLIARPPDQHQPAALNARAVDGDFIKHLRSVAAALQQVATEADDSRREGVASASVVGGGGKRLSPTRRHGQNDLVRRLGPVGNGALLVKFHHDDPDDDHDAPNDPHQQQGGAAGGVTLDDATRPSASHRRSDLLTLTNTSGEGDVAVSGAGHDETDNGARELNATGGARGRGRGRATSPSCYALKIALEGINTRTFRCPAAIIDPPPQPGDALVVRMWDGPIRAGTVVSCSPWSGHRKSRGCGDSGDVLRRMTPADAAQLGQVVQPLAKEALSLARQLVAQRGLPVELVSASCFFDGSTVVVMLRDVAWSAIDAAAPSVTKNNVVQGTNAIAKAVGQSIRVPSSGRPLRLIWTRSYFAETTAISF